LSFHQFYYITINTHTHTHTHTHKIKWSCDHFLLIENITSFLLLSSNVIILMREQLLYKSFSTFLTWKTIEIIPASINRCFRIRRATFVEVRYTITHSIGSIKRCHATREYNVFHCRTRGVLIYSSALRINSWFKVDAHRRRTRWTLQRLRLNNRDLLSHRSWKILFATKISKLILTWKIPFYLVRSSQFQRGLDTLGKHFEINCHREHGTMKKIYVFYLGSLAALPSRLRKRQCEKRSWAK